MARGALPALGDHGRLTARLTPNASRDAIDGFETAADGEEHLKVRVRAVPANGKANYSAARLIRRAKGL